MQLINAMLLSEIGEDELRSAMNRDVYAFWPIELKHNRRFFGPRKGKCYFRFGMGARWELKRDGSRRKLGWSFFIGPYRLIFGKRNFLAEVSNY